MYPSKTLFFYNVDWFNHTKYFVLLVDFIQCNSQTSFFFFFAFLYAQVSAAARCIEFK